MTIFQRPDTGNYIVTCDCGQHTGYVLQEDYAPEKRWHLKLSIQRICALATAHEFV